jgi:hypothetical protein
MRKRFRAKPQREKKTFTEEEMNAVYGAEQDD